jgi:hypothetical protein
MRRMVVYESRLELARIMLADFDPSVVAIARPSSTAPGTATNP